MAPRLLLLVIFTFVLSTSCAQSQVRKFPPSINHPGFNNFAPFISLDGTALVYLSNVAEDDALALLYTSKNGPDWRDPVQLPKSINHHLNFIRGFGLSADGKSVYVSNPKANGVGGYDLYVSRYNGTSWSEPENLTLPINTKGNEACPSFTTDGNTMYFMRCESMDTYKAAGCSLWMVSKKPNGQWGDPQAFPAFINTGNSQAPRILGDGETLIFSSDKLSPNQGGMDLYMTKWSAGHWSSPLPLNFTNSPGDDQFASASALGMYLLRDAKGTRNQELIEMLFPTELKPKAVMKIEGTVSIEGGTAPFVTVFNLKDQTKAAFAQPGKDGKFFLYVPEGNRYELSIEPDRDNYTYYSKVYDLTGERIPQVERVNTALRPLSAGDEIALEDIRFRKSSAELDPEATQEMRRLTRMLKGNPSRYFAFEVLLKGHVIDSVRSDADLTEVTTDTLKIPVTFRIDSVTTGTRDSIVLRTRYHNDRTLKQAQTIAQYLIQEGIPSARIAVSGKAEGEAIIENRKTLVKLIVH